MELLYQAMLAEAKRLAVPAAMYDEFSLAEVSDLSEWMPSDTISVVLALCTLGPRLEERINELAQNDLASARDNLSIRYYFILWRL